MNKLFIVRHGETDWNNKKLLQGLTDIDLNEVGVKQSYNLSKKISEIDIDFCISSPLKRALNTTEILNNGKLEVIVDDSIVERCFGDYEGSLIDMDIIFKQWDYNLNLSSGNIESIRDCLERASKFLNKISSLYDNKSILIVTHGAFMKALHFNIIGYNNDTDFLSFNPKNCVVYEYFI